VDVVQVPGIISTPSLELHELFEVCIALTSCCTYTD
jgi:hypothetical protein